MNCSGQSIATEDGRKLLHSTQHVDRSRITYMNPRRVTSAALKLLSIPNPLISIDRSTGKEVGIIDGTDSVETEVTDAIIDLLFPAVDDLPVESFLFSPFMILLLCTKEYGNDPMNAGRPDVGHTVRLTLYSHGSHTQQ